MFRNSPFSLLVYQTTWWTSFNSELFMGFFPLKLSDITAESFLHSESPLLSVCYHQKPISYRSSTSIHSHINHRWSYLPLVHDWLALTTRRRRAPKMIQKERRSYSIVSCNTGFIMSLSHNQNDAFQVRPDCTNCQAVRHQAWSSWTQANLPRTWKKNITVLNAWLGHSVTVTSVC